MSTPSGQQRKSCPNVPASGAIANLARAYCAARQERYVGQVNFQRRLVQAFSADASGQLNQEAQAWWELSLNPLGDALKQSFKLPSNPLKNPRAAGEREPYLHEKRAENDRLTRHLTAAEAELNDRVYRLFHLTPDEINLLQKAVKH